MRKSLLTLGLLFLSHHSHAYLAISETAEIIPPDHYQFGLEPQVFLNEGGGVNGTLFFDAPIDDATSARISVGVGEIDFNTFATIKHVPFPDIDNQPAIGVRAGIGTAREDSENSLILQAGPIISKKTETDMGMMTPFVALPVSFINAKSENYIASQLALGTEFTLPDVERMRFGAEVGFNVNRSYSYVSGYITFPFDAKKGY